MSRFTLVAILVLGTFAALACSGAVSPTQPDLTGTHLVAGNPDNHVSWGVFDLVLDAGNGTAEIVWKRDAGVHVNVTSSVTPPNCYDCVSVVDASYDHNALKFYVQVAFRNPTPLMGYDVRAVIQNPGGQKFLLNPDGMTTVWGGPMQFRAINVDPERTFGGHEVHGRLFTFYFPPGENFKTITYIIDASYPGHVMEPLIEEGYSDPVANNGFSTTFVRAKVFDHQNDINPATIMADLLPLGGSPQTQLFDDGLHNDGAAGDSVYGSEPFATTVPVGVYMANVYAVDMSGHMGWGQVAVPVRQTTGGPNDDPIITDITTSRTTANGARNETIVITVTAIDPNGDPLGYDFQASSGTFPSQDGNSAIWRPSSKETGPQLITITVMDDRGGIATKSGTLWSTDMPIINGSTNGAIPSGSLTSVLPETTLDMTEDLKGEVVYINIWATWCPYCVVELPDLTAVYNKYKSTPGYNQIYLNDGESRDTVESFIQQHDYACTYWCLDPGGSYFGKLKPFNGGGSGVPQHFLFDRDNNCRYARIGAYMSGTQELEEAIEQLL